MKFNLVILVYIAAQRKKYGDEVRDNEDDWKDHSKNYESIEEGKIDNFFNNFRRTIPTRDVANKIPTGGNGQRYFYNSKTGTYDYVDETGKRHDTGIGYGEGRVGMNWNPFKSTEGHQVSKGDAADAKRKLMKWNSSNPERIRAHNETMRNLEQRWTEQERAREEERKERERRWAQEDRWEEERRRHGDPERGYYPR